MLTATASSSTRPMTWRHYSKLSRVKVKIWTSDRTFLPYFSWHIDVRTTSVLIKSEDHDLVLGKQRSQPCNVVPFLFACPAAFHWACGWHCGLLGLGAWARKASSIVETNSEACSWLNTKLIPCHIWWSPLHSHAYYSKLNDTNKNIVQWVEQNETNFNKCVQIRTKF